MEILQCRERKNKGGIQKEGNGRQWKSLTCHLTPVRMAVIKKKTNNKRWQGYG